MAYVIIPVKVKPPRFTTSCREEAASARSGTSQLQRAHRQGEGVDVFVNEDNLKINRTRADISSRRITRITLEFFNGWKSTRWEVCSGGQVAAFLRVVVVWAGVGKSPCLEALGPDGSAVDAAPDRSSVLSVQPRGAPLLTGDSQTAPATWGWGHRPRNDWTAHPRRGSGEFRRVLYERF
jgi:hypothetical protein